MGNELEQLINIMAMLRSEKGCPWDKEQTKESLKPYLIEETYELVEAIEENNPKKIKEELGDLLFQIIFHCQIAAENKQFNIYDVIDKISKKIVNRHPHVFASMEVTSTQEIKKQWHEIKREEGKFQESILQGIPKKLPGLLRAQRLQSRASKVGFDWHRIEDVITKVEEELKELKTAIESKQKKNIEEELGDIIFVLVNVARFAGINAEDALNKTTTKFINRFQFIEKKAKEAGTTLSEMTLEEMDSLWEEAKRLL
ncbi:MAG: nucleoside triphosphate pyrophosphohydrolase [Thermodesulfovibrionales bacterium]|nr:nucleoside triphosphate pyrophosphohydrolase [Thermodesulfovibrionales bacterium]